MKRFLKALPAGLALSIVSTAAPGATNAAATGGIANTADAQLAANRRLVERYFGEVWTQGKIDLLDQLLTADYVNHSPSTPNPRPGPADLKPIVAAMRAGIPDLKYEILDMVVAPDKVAVYVRLTGTHQGTLFGMPPTGKKIDVRQMQIEWIKDGRIAQHWRITDELSMMRQLGQVQ